MLRLSTWQLVLPKGNEAGRTHHLAGASVTIRAHALDLTLTPHSLLARADELAELVPPWTSESLDSVGVFGTEGACVFILDGQIHWSASDLTAAAACEYAVARTLDYKLKRAEGLDAAADPLQEHIARLGDRHEATLLAERAGDDLIELARVDPPYTAAALQAAREATHEAFLAEPSFVYQAAFYDGEFFGYADFVERTADGWVVADAKLARSAKPRALLQLGAYADQVERLGLPLARHVALLLGNGQRVEFPVSDVMPVFRERRERLRELLTRHQAAGPVAWGDDSYVACGRCGECDHAAAQTNDVIGVAGMRTTQRHLLREAKIETIADLAVASAKPEGMAEATFAKLRAQAALQWKQLQGGESAPVEYELIDTAAKALHALPKPSAGDLFFDFEGDPLYDEGDPSRVGLEYLWGVMDSAESYEPIWAHDSTEERAAFVRFLDLVAQRRTANPEMHVYHYAPYETTALKRLAIRYQAKEEELDDLLRGSVFVDLYATVRGAVRISRDSYSIKKLEPLYMGARLRDAGGVQAGGDSILAYHEARDWRSTEPAKAQAKLDDLEAYNTYDCLSTLRLRDWLLARAAEVPAPQRADDANDAEPETPSANAEANAAKRAAREATAEALLARSGPELRTQRTPTEQAFAMLASALAYHPRESKTFWWAHYERLTHPLPDWSGARDVFTVQSVRLEQDWTLPSARSKNLQRILELTGDWAPGSKPSSGAHVVYETPCPPGVGGPKRAPYGTDEAKIQYEESTPRAVRLTESRKTDDVFADRPVALAPSAPPRTDVIEDAIDLVAQQAATSAELPLAAVFDLLTRRAPRLRGDAALPSAGTAIENVVAALVGMDDSYVAIQGPPGSGKTWSGSQIVKRLVEEHHWRIGVVAQSHAVVETMLAAVVRAGLDPALVGKSNNDSPAPTWTDVANTTTARAKFLSQGVETGCVLGGTAWTFANDDLVEAGGLDLLVVDEAGQFSLAPTVGVSICAKRLLLLGDPQQLPQVSQGTHPEPVDASALGWVMGRQDVLPASHGYFLAESHRMHPALCAKVSTLSYAGRLRSAPPASRHHLDGVPPGLAVVEIDHEGNQTESAEEAAEVVAQVQAHLGRTWTDPDDTSTPRPLAARDFLVVAPYNAQVALIRKALDAAGFTATKVGTVDKFQGQEAPIAIVSMTASSHGDVPRGMAFLLSRNRVNVAVSRAQWKAILIRSSVLTSFMPTSVDGVLQLGAFIGLCTAESH